MKLNRMENLVYAWTTVIILTPLCDARYPIENIDPIMTEETRRPFENSPTKGVKKVPDFYRKVEQAIREANSEISKLKDKLEIVEDQLGINLHNVSNNTDAGIDQGMNFVEFRNFMTQKIKRIQSAQATNFQKLSAPKWEEINVTANFEKMFDLQNQNIKRLERMVLDEADNSLRAEIRYQFARTNSLPSMITYIQGLASQRQNVGYKELVSIMKTDSTSISNINFICLISQIPELSSLASQIPQNLRVIFNNQTKALQMRNFPRRLVIDSSSLQTTKSFDTKGSKQWTFLPVDDTCEYFFILNQPSNMTVGVVDNSFSTPSDRNKKMDINLLEGVLEDGRYHWQISVQSNGYYLFTNRATGMMLDANDKDQVYPHTKNGGSHQDWSLI